MGTSTGSIRAVSRTGTPVPVVCRGKAIALLRAIKRSRRRIVGLDLCEVSPGGTEWDANVGARLLYKMIGFALLTQGLSIIAPRLQRGARRSARVRQPLDPAPSSSSSGSPLTSEVGSDNAARGASSPPTPSPEPGGRECLPPRGPMCRLPMTPVAGRVSPRRRRRVLHSSPLHLADDGRNGSRGNGFDGAANGRTAIIASARAAPEVVIGPGRGGQGRVDGMISSRQTNVGRPPSPERTTAMARPVLARKPMAALPTGKVSAFPCMKSEPCPTHDNGWKTCVAGTSTAALIARCAGRENPINHAEVSSVRVVEHGRLGVDHHRCRGRGGRRGLRTK